MSIGSMSENQGHDTPEDGTYLVAPMKEPKVWKGKTNILRFDASLRGM